MAYREGMTTRQLSEYYGIGKTSVTKLLRLGGVPLRYQSLSAEQLRQAAQLYKNGKSVAQVAKVLELPSSSVYDALKRTGVEIRSAHEPGRRRPA